MTDADNSNDRDLFRTRMHNVRPLAGRKRVERQRPMPAPEPVQTRLEQKQVLRESLADTGNDANFDPDPDYDAQSWSRPGVQHRVLRKLRRGQVRMDAELDLHGLNATAAQTQVRAFLNQAVQHDLQCVRIIHGKGLGSGNRGPVLKRKLGGWLRRRDDVLAYCGARPADGGSGATYVLLRRKK